MGSFTSYLDDLEQGKRPRRARTVAPPQPEPVEFEDDESEGSSNWRPIQVGPPPPPLDTPPPPDSERIVRNGIDRQKAVDRKYQRPEDEDYFIQRVKNVVEAIDQRDTTVLRAALIDVAALSENWASRLAGGVRA